LFASLFTAGPSGRVWNGDFPASSRSLARPAGTGPPYFDESAAAMTMLSSAPILDTSFNPALTSIPGESTNPAGISVAELVDGSISYDVDNDVEAIAITALDTSLGVWQYSVDSGASWLAIDAGLLNSDTNELALLLGPTAQLRLLPFGELSGTLSAAVTFRAWDMTSGAQGDYTAIESTGGVSAFSAESDTASVSVDDVNQSPFFAPTSLSGGMFEVMNAGSGLEYANGVMLQPDGNILVAGFTIDPELGPVVGLMLLHPDGFLHTGFGVDGRLVLPLLVSESFEFLSGQGNVLLQPDGKIVVAGEGSEGDFLLMRLNANGSTDTSFGDSGIAAFVGIDNGAKQVLLQADGKIVVAEVQGSDYALWRVNADGSADTAFGVDGAVQASLGGVSMVAASAVLQADGKLILSGYSYDGGEGDDQFSVLRLNADGSVDTGFGTDGRFDLDGGDDDRAACVTVQADGKIVVAGASDGLDDDMQLSVVRLTASGELDTSFGTGGKFLLPLVDGQGFDGEIALSVLAQPDGKIVLAHFGANDGDDHVGFGVVRLSAAGELDPGFGGAGRFVSSLGMITLATSVALQPDGKIVVAGLSVDFDGGAPTLGFGAQRVNPDGSADADFGGHVLGGAVSYARHADPVALDTAVAVYDAELALLADGDGDYAGASLTLARHGGAAAEDLFSATGELVLDDDGKALLGGVEVGSYTNAGGTLAITFNHGATQARVDAVLSSLAYANSSDAPPASTQIDWTFSDGNVDDAQGEGGVRSSVGHVTVNTAPIAPTLTGFSAAVDRTAAGRQVEITFADLAAKGDEADQDGSVVGFVVTQLSGGTLKIGASAATAVDWADVSRTGGDLNARPVLNGLIDATQHAYWTPEPGVTGDAVDAFKVVALDDTAYRSATAVQVTVAVVRASSAPEPTPAPPPPPPPVPVDDHDNVPNAVENAAPGLPATPGGSAVAGDGNGDGIADSEQAAVTSVAILHSDSAASNPGAAPAAYVTLAAQAPGGGVDGGVQIGAFVQQDAPAQLPAHMDMPLGLFDFSATVGAPSASQAFSLIVDASLGANGYWVQSDGVWINLASAAYGGQVVALEGGKIRLDFKLADGGAFDTDHAANGSIDNVGAVGAMPLTLVGFAPPAPEAGAHWF
jgi:uncharacterized delta-60 repeat protein